MPYVFSRSSPRCPPTPTMSTRSFSGIHPYMSSRTPSDRWLTSREIFSSMRDSHEGWGSASKSPLPDARAVVMPRTCRRVRLPPDATRADRAVPSRR